MTDPIKPEYQFTVWQPTVDTSDSDVGDEKSAAAKYDATYGGSYSTTTTASTSSQSSTPSSPGYIPTLSMAYTTAPDLIPLPNTGGQGAGGSTAPLSDPFSIRLGDLMSTEQTFLESTNAAVDGYQTLSTVVNGAISSNSIFGQIVGTQPNVGDNKASWLTGDGVTYDKLDSEGTSFANAVNPQMEHLLQAVGNTVEALGYFTALLNNAGQMYTETDAQSAFPPPGLMEGPNPQQGPSS
jgi:hypothetical protein